MHGGKERLGESCFNTTGGQLVNRKFLVYKILHKFGFFFLFVHFFFSFISHSASHDNYYK